MRARLFGTFCAALSCRELFGKVSRPLLCLAVLLVVLAPSLGRAADPELPEIIQKLREWRQSFATIRVTWRAWNRNDFIQQHPDLDPDEELGKRYYAEDEFLWADWGGLKWESVEHAAGVAIHRTLLGVEGSNAWEAESEYGKDASQLVMFRRLNSLPDKPMATNVAFLAVEDLWRCKEGLWIDEYFQKMKQTSLEGYEDLDGHRCAVVRIVRDLKKEDPRIPSDTFVVDEGYWLDVEHGFLPRKMQVVGNWIGEEGMLNYSTRIVDEFFQVDGRVWFPRKGRTRMSTMAEPGFNWEVSRCVVNDPLPRTLFQPPKITPQKKTAASGRDSGVSTSGQSGGQSRPLAIPSWASWKWVIVVGAVVVALGIIWRWRRVGGR